MRKGWLSEKKTPTDQNLSNNIRYELFELNILSSFEAAFFRLRCRLWSVFSSLVVTARCDFHSNFARHRTIGRMSGKIVVHLCALHIYTFPVPRMHVLTKYAYRLRRRVAVLTKGSDQISETRYLISYACSTRCRYLVYLYVGNEEIFDQLEAVDASCQHQCQPFAYQLESRL